MIKECFNILLPVYISISTSMRRSVVILSLTTPDIVFSLNSIWSSDLAKYVETLSSSDWENNEEINIEINK